LQFCDLRGEFDNRHVFRRNGLWLFSGARQILGWSTSRGYRARRGPTIINNIMTEPRRLHRPPLDPEERARREAERQIEHAMYGAIRDALAFGRPGQNPLDLGRRLDMERELLAELAERFTVAAPEYLSPAGRRIWQEAVEITARGIAELILDQCSAPSRC
jgi:hypothetical protein